MLYLFIVILLFCSIEETTKWLMDSSTHLIGLFDTKKASKCEVKINIEQHVPLNIIKLFTISLFKANSEKDDKIIVVRKLKLIGTFF